MPLSLPPIPARPISLRRRFVVLRRSTHFRCYFIGHRVNSIYHQLTAPTRLPPVTSHQSAPAYDLYIPFLPSPPPHLVGGYDRQCRMGNGLLLSLNFAKKKKTEERRTKIDRKNEKYEEEISHRALMSIGRRRETPMMRRLNTQEERKYQILKVKLE